MPSSACHVCVTSASKKVPLVRAVMNAAKRIHPGSRVTAGDVDAEAVTRYVADEFWVMPPCVESEANRLLEGCRERGITVLLPTRDGELLFWATHADRFAAEGIAILVGGPAAVGRCLDKLSFSAFGKEIGLPVVPTFERIDEAGRGPYVVKERYGAGSRRVGLCLNAQDALAHAAGLEYPVYQPFVEGGEISVDAWLNRENRVKGLVLRRRDVVVNGESQVTTTFRHAELEQLFRATLEGTALRGSVMSQAILDETDAPHIIECNPRFGGASTASIAVGLDAFYWSLLETMGADINAVPFNRAANEVLQVRVPQDIYVSGADL